MTARRISDIVKALMRAKALGAKLTGKSAIEKELNAWIHAPPIICEPISWTPKPIDYPSKYEDTVYSACV